VRHIHSRARFLDPFDIRPARSPTCPRAPPAP
jgi:hypothetical protein